MGQSSLRCTISGSVVTIALARPDRLNAFDVSMHAELRDMLDKCEKEDSIKVVVLTGEGRAFSSGQDLTEDFPRDAQGRVDLGVPLARDYNPLVLKLANYSKLTIAALNGPAVGASMNIALACDMVVAARSSYLLASFARIALVPDAGATWTLPRLVGPKQALALMLSAEPIPAEEAQRMGLVFKVFEDETFREDVAAFAAHFAKGPGLAYRLTKQAVAQSFANDLETQLDLEARFQTLAGHSRDSVEGMAAFREKRAPRFEGR